MLISISGIKIRLSSFFFLFCLCHFNSALAENIPEGEKSIFLIDNQQQKTHIADISFTHIDGAAQYHLQFSEENFQQEFLSMRPFKCLHKSSKIICHFEYLYDKSSRLTQNNLMDLEYDLLFLHKTPEEYGINAWNGLYYRLSLNNETISGELMEVDLNILTSPPKEGVGRPVTYDMLHPVKAGHHEFPSLVIE